MKRRSVVAGAALWCALAAIAHAADGVGSPTLRVTGRVEQPATFAPADLARLPEHEVAVVAESGATRRYRGALLRDVLAACRPLAQGRFDLRRSVFVASATDGYLAVFTWAEIFNTPIGDDVVIATTVDGAAIPDGEGPLVLVSGKDLRSGPRHVRWLAGVDVRLVEP